MFNHVVTKNLELKSLLDNVDNAKSALESETKTLSRALHEKDEQTLAQLTEKDAKIMGLELELEASCTNAKVLVEQLSVAKLELLDSSNQKLFVHNLQPTILSLKSYTESFATETRELIELFALYQRKVTTYAQRSKKIHSDEITKIEIGEKSLRAEVERLSSLCKEGGKKVKESNSTIDRLEQTITRLNRIAENVDSARKGENLSWETAMEEAKTQHRKELARLHCIAQDERERQNKIIRELEADTERQKEDHNQECRVWSNKVNDINAALSKTEKKSSNERQRLITEMTELSKRLAIKEDECSTLTCHIESTKQEASLQLEHMQKVHHMELEVSRQKHQLEIEDNKRIHLNLLRQVEEESREKLALCNIKLVQLEQDKENMTTNHKQQIEALERRIVSEYTARILELKSIKNELHHLHHTCSINIDKANDEWKSMCSNIIAAKLKSMKRCYDELIVRHNEETEQAESAHSEALSRLKDKSNHHMVAASKETQDTKQILFQTIRENEMKLGREIGHLREEHELEMKRLVNENKDKCDEMASKIQSLNQGFESLASEDARKGDQICCRDITINELNCKVSRTKQYLILVLDFLDSTQHFFCPLFCQDV